MLITSLVSCSLLLTPLDIDASISSISGEFEQSIYMPGTLIGNWDPKMNPEGTSTLPGIWGGSGNNPIECELTPAFGGPYDSSSSGSLEVEIDSVNNQMTITNLHLSAFDDEPAMFPVSLGMLYETFRTVQPDSLFPGGIQVDIPLGTGSIISLQFDQEFEIVADLVQVDSQSWTFDVVIPVITTFELAIFETPSGPLSSPGLMPLTGTVVQTGNQIQLTSTSMLESDEVIEDPPFSFEDVPFDVPTILPPGDFAHLLFSANAELATSSNTISIQLVATGSSATPGDVDGDGIVGVSDLLAIIAVWGPCQGCDEDLTGDGYVNVTDLLEVIANW